AEVAGARREVVAEGEGAQGRVTAGTATSDHCSVPVDEPFGCEVAHGVDAVVDVDDAPLSSQALAVLAAVPRAAAVVDVDDSEPPRGPELRRHVEGRRRRRGRSTVAHDDQRWA